MPHPFLKGAIAGEDKCWSKGSILSPKSQLSVLSVQNNWPTFFAAQEKKIKYRLIFATWRPQEATAIFFFNLQNTGLDSLQFSQTDQNTEVAFSFTLKTHNVRLTFPPLHHCFMMISSDSKAIQITCFTENL